MSEGGPGWARRVIQWSPGSSIHAGRGFRGDSRGLNQARPMSHTQPCVTKKLRKPAVPRRARNQQNARTCLPVLAQPVHSLVECSPLPAPLYGGGGCPAGVRDPTNFRAQCPPSPRSEPLSGSVRTPTARKPVPPAHLAVRPLLGRPCRWPLGTQVRRIGDELVEAKHVASDRHGAIPRRARRLIPRLRPARHRTRPTALQAPTTQGTRRHARVMRISRLTLDRAAIYCHLRRRTSRRRTSTRATTT